MKENKPKVLHLITRFLAWGGSEKNTILSLQALIEEGYDVHLGVGVKSQSKLLNVVRNKGVKVHKFQHLCNKVNPRKDFQAIVEIYRYLRSNHIEIVHTHQTKAGMLGRLAAFFARVPIIIYGIHGSTFSGLKEPLSSSLLVLEKINSLITDAFVSVGNDLKNRFLEKGIGSSDRYYVIRSAMDLAPFFQASKLGVKEKQKIREDIGINPDEIALGKVASLEPRKGHNYALEVMGSISKIHSNVKLLFVGKGEREYKSKLKSLVRGRGLEDKIIFTGYREDIDKIMGALDIFIFTSLREGLPQVLVQATAVGLPIVTFNVEGATEVIEHGANGYIVPLRDTESFVNSLSEMLDNLNKARKMGMEGRNNLKSRKDEWDIEKMKNDTKYLYKDLISTEGL